MSQTNTAINTIKYIKHLEKAGFYRPQAEALAEANAEFIGHTFATHQQLENVRNELKYEIQSVHTELKNEIQSVRTELKSEIQSVRTELKNEIQSVQKDTIIKLGAAMVGCTTVLGVLIGFLH